MNEFESHIFVCVNMCLRCKWKPLICHGLASPVGFPKVEKRTTPCDAVRRADRDRISCQIINNERKADAIRLLRYYKSKNIILGNDVVCDCQKWIWKLNNAIDRNAKIPFSVYFCVCSLFTVQRPNVEISIWSFRMVKLMLELTLTLNGSCKLQVASCNTYIESSSACEHTSILDVMAHRTQHVIFCFCFTQFKMDLYANAKRIRRLCSFKHSLMSGPARKWDNCANTNDKKKQPHRNRSGGSFQCHTAKA